MKTIHLPEPRSVRPIEIWCLHRRLGDPIRSIMFVVCIFVGRRGGLNSVGYYLGFFWRHTANGNYYMGKTFNHLPFAHFKKPLSDGGQRDIYTIVGLISQGQLVSQKKKIINMMESFGILHFGVTILRHLRVRYITSVVILLILSLFLYICNSRPFLYRKHHTQTTKYDFKRARTLLCHWSEAWWGCQGPDRNDWKWYSLCLLHKPL